MGRMENSLCLFPAELEELKATVRAINETLKSRESCYYCADAATCEDHVIPHSLLYRKATRRRGYSVDTLPSCRECNSLLSSSVFDSLSERIAYLVETVQARYSIWIGREAWKPYELAELAPGLLSFAMEFNRVKELTENRLAYLVNRKARTPVLAASYAPPERFPLEIETRERELEKTWKRRVYAIAKWDGKECAFRLASKMAYKHRGKPFRKRLAI